VDQSPWFETESESETWVKECHCQWWQCHQHIPQDKCTWQTENGVNKIKRSTLEQVIPNSSKTKLKWLNQAWGDFFKPQSVQQSLKTRCELPETIKPSGWSMYTSCNSPNELCNDQVYY